MQPDLDFVKATLLKAIETLCSIDPKSDHMSNECLDVIVRNAESELSSLRHRLKSDFEERRIGRVK